MPALTYIQSVRTKPMATIGTHNGSFHADDAFGVAVLQELLPLSQLVRTRDPEILRNADFTVDVAGEWDPSRGRFDHHQKGFKGARPDGTVYASAGLVWAAYGELYALKHAPTLSVDDAARVAQALDETLVAHLDRADTGAAAGAPGLFGLSALLAQFNVNWTEDAGLTAEERANLLLARFMEAVSLVQQILPHCVHAEVAKLMAAQHVRAARREQQGQVLVLETSGLPWYEVVCHEMPEVRFVVYPDSTDAQYQLRTVPVTPESFTARLDLPRAWAGLRDQALADVSGVPDAVFCHNGCFIAGAVSLEGALRMAELALQSAQA